MYERCPEYATVLDTVLTAAEMRQRGNGIEASMMLSNASRGLLDAGLLPDTIAELFIEARIEETIVNFELESL